VSGLSYSGFVQLVPPAVQQVGQALDNDLAVVPGSSSSEG
jgi:hypothetical protein